MAYRGNMKSGSAAPMPAGEAYALILGDDEFEGGEAQLEESRRRASSARVCSYDPHPGRRSAMTHISSERIASIEARKHELQQAMSAPDLSRDEFVRLSKDYAAIEPVAAAAREVRRLRAELVVLNGIVADPTAEAELKEMAAAEAEEIRHKLPQAERALAFRLLPRDAADDRAAMLEVRAGTGGDEAALFAGDLVRMYQRFAEAQGWRFELISASPSEVGGYKEAIASINGSGVFAKLKFESGVHRVQRVPVTESGGRIHTSAATVAVLPEAEDVDVQIDDKDLRIDVYRSSAQGASRSTPPTARSGSRTCRPALSSSSRMKNRSTRTRPRR